MENKLVTAVTILDLSATFDTVDHDLHLEVLQNKFGIDGHALKWYNKYLKPRNSKSTLLEPTQQIPQQVPQGSPEGAFLFIAYA